MLKFMFSKKATKIDEIFSTVDLTLHNFKSSVKISSILVAFLENMNFNLKSRVLINHIVPSPSTTLVLKKLSHHQQPSN